MGLSRLDHSCRARDIGLSEPLRRAAHGGIGIGFDRVVMLMAGRVNIRDTIAFPKTASATCPMEGSPSEVDESVWKELHLKPDAGV